MENLFWCVLGVSVGFVASVLYFGFWMKKFVQTINQIQNIQNQDDWWKEGKEPPWENTNA